MNGGWVYIMTNGPNGTLYVGVTSQREKTLKHWSRSWKVQLILRENPEWDDLYDQLL